MYVFLKKRQNFFHQKNFGLIAYISIETLLSVETDLGLPHMTSKMICTCKLDGVSL